MKLLSKESIIFYSILGAFAGFVVAPFIRSLLDLSFTLEIIITTAIKDIIISGTINQPPFERIDNNDIIYLKLLIDFFLRFLSFDKGREWTYSYAIPSSLKLWNIDFHFISRKPSFN